jgi:hypothetical protein
MTVPESKAPCCKHSVYRKCWEEEPWSVLTGRESQLDISQQAYVEKSQPMHQELKRQVNSENNATDTQTSDSKHTWGRSEKHTRRKAGERKQQLMMISAPSTGRMPSVPTSAPTWRRLSATAGAPEMMRRSSDRASLIHAEQVQLCLPMQF